jgi:hypothetical protein
MKASKKYMFQKIKFLRSNKYFITEAQDQTGKNRRMDILIAKENNLFIEQSLKWQMNLPLRKKKMIKNNRIKKVQAWRLCCKA